MGYGEDFRAEIDRQMAELKADDDAAKKAGTLVGRYIRESIADGYAYYVIVKAGHSRTVTVEHVHICDGYRVPMIESMDGKIPVKYARENIAMRDKWEKLFEMGKKGE